MALYDLTWYVNSVGYTAVPVRPQNTAVAAGVLRRQFTAPTVGNERCFVCVVAGTTANVTDATWVLTRGAKTVDGTATWQECTGASAVNGDLTNTVNWTAAKAAGTPTLGAIIKRNSGASYQICTTAGTMAASEPAFSDTAGVTTADGTSVWTSLGPVGNFAGGSAPFARLAAAFGTNWYIPGNTVYVGDNHAESQSTSISILPAAPASAATVGKIICHNHSSSYPPASGDLMTGATITTTGTGAITFNPAGSIYVYGITLKAGVGSASGGTYINLQTQNFSNWVYWDNCSIQVASTGGSSALFNLGSSVPVVTSQIFNNTTVSFGNVAQFISNLSAQFTWQNTGLILAAGSSIPTALFSVSANAFFFNILLEALDLSQLTGSLCVNTISSVSVKGTMLVKDCKLNAALSFATPSLLDVNYQIVRSDSGATGYKSSRYSYEGTETTEATITRVGGAVDPTGQAQSRKIVTSANTQWLRPFKAEPYGIWNDRTVTNVVVTVYGTINAGAVPNNDDIWLELEYLGSALTPLGTIVNTTKANVLAAAAAVASDGSSWNGGGSGAGWSPFKLTKTLSAPQPGLPGYIHARVRAAKASATYYIDPVMVLS